MSKSLKIVIAAIIGLLLIVLAVQYFQIKSLRKTNEIQAVELMNANDSAKVFKTKAGEMYFNLNAVTVESNALKNSLISSGFEIKDLRAKDIKWRNIVSTLKAELAMTGHDTINLRDTVYIPSSGPSVAAKSYNWTNNYLSLAGLIRGQTMDINYSYKVGLSFITETKGKSTKVTASLLDPNARITTGAQIIVANKTRWYEKPWLWGVAGAVGGYYLGK